MSERLFLGLALSAPAREALAAFCASQLRPLFQVAPPVAQWVEPVNYHLTLHFLGVCETRPRFLASLPEIARGVSSFALKLDRVDAFPHRGRPRILWVGAHHIPAALMSLHAAIAETMRSGGWSFIEDSFQPHVTIARLKWGQGGAAVPDVFSPTPDIPTIAVEGLHLYLSHSTNAGLRYTILETYTLG